MNKKVGIIVGVVVVVALIAFFATRTKKTDENKSTTTQTQSNEVKSSSESASLKSLLATGGSKTCTFSNTEAGATSQGTVYLSSGKMRGDFSSTVNGATQANHMITDGQTSYVWMDGQKSGFKMSFASTETGNNAQSQSSVDTNKNMNFSCNNWAGDQSKFSLPSDVEFSAITTMLEMPKPSMSGGMQDVSKACDQLPEPAKAQCLAALEK